MSNNYFSLELIQDETKISFDMSSEKKITISRMAGGIANQVDRYMSLVKACGGARVFKFNKPFQIKFSSETELIFDSQKIMTRIALDTKVKLLNNDKSKRRFAAMLFNMLHFAMESGSMPEFSEYIERVNQRIEEREAQKQIAA